MACSEYRIVPVDSLSYNTARANRMVFGNPYVRMSVQNGARLGYRRHAGSIVPENGVVYQMRTVTKQS